MGPDPKWLDILKASGWQFGCLALGAWFAVIANKNGWLPVQLDQTFIQFTMLGAIALSALWVASVGSTATKWSAAPISWIKKHLALRSHAKAFEDYIPYMTEEERAVFAQLLHENRKSFTAADDGGHAATLLGRGFIRVIAVRGQMVSMEDVPFAVPDHIWDVAARRRDDFPYTPNEGGADAWRVHWMAR